MDFGLGDSIINEKILFKKLIWHGLIQFVNMSGNRVNKINSVNIEMVGSQRLEATRKSNVERLNRHSV